MRETYYPPADAISIDAVRAEITVLPKCRYRREGASVNRQRVAAGLALFNHRRFYRVMSLTGYCFLYRYPDRYQPFLRWPQSNPNVRHYWLSID